MSQFKYLMKKGKKGILITVILLFGRVCYLFLDLHIQIQDKSWVIKVGDTIQTSRRSNSKEEILQVTGHSSEQLCVETCKPDDVMCQPRSFGAWNKLLLSNQVKFKPLLPGNVKSFTWEEQLLAFPSLTDSKTLPDLNRSIFKMAGGGRENSVKCRVGERLKGRVDLLDSYGKTRGAGLDEVRAWMVDKVYPKRKAAAQVTDLRNGSYVIHSTCLWDNSEAILRVAVSYPREFLRVVVKQVRDGVNRFLSGQFESKDGTQEWTICSPTPNIPGRSCICDFTTFNRREFYCGQPLDTRLNCSHWRRTTTLRFPRPYNVTHAEASLITSIPGSFRDRALKTEILIVTGKSRQSKPNALPNCNNMSTDITWDITSRPQGFWDKNGSWQSLLCHNEHRQPLWECFKNSKLYFIGDSNTRYMYDTLRKWTRCRWIVGDWPKPFKGRNNSFNISINLSPHEYPLYIRGQFSDVMTTGSVESQIDSLPSNGRLVLILHYYLHVMSSHLSVAISRLQAAARAIRRLLHRNSDARIAFRGPHVSSRQFEDNHSIGGDPLGQHFLELIRDTFSDIRDRVLFLDGWEMSSTLESESYHPPPKVTEEMLKMLASFYCG